MAADPYQPFPTYESAAADKGKGKGKGGGGPVPEPATAGLLLVAFCVALYLARRLWVKRGGRLCQCGCTRRDRSDGGTS